MSKPAYVFDGRNILDHNRLEQIGFQVVAIGKSFNGLEYRHGAN
jgi:UDPglucose 6-dehydrogenase